MSFLVLDSSSNCSFIALINRDGIVWSTFFENQKCSALFAAEIKKRFAAGIKGVERIIAGTGPGAFTGIRVALSLAQGLARGSGIPMGGISALNGYLSKKEGLFASVIDARIGGVYALLQKREREKIIPIGEPRFVKQEEFKCFFESCVEVVGPDLSRLMFPVSAVEARPDLHYLYKLIFESKTLGFEPLYLTSPVVSP
jgi:tRNA threonylcarbamoyladenosine biosynthesis protein TsaB